MYHHSEFHIWLLGICSLTAIFTLFFAIAGIAILVITPFDTPTLSFILVSITGFFVSFTIGAIDFAYLWFSED